VGEQRFKPLKPFILLALFLLAWWLVPTAVKSMLRVSFAEFQAPVMITASYLDDLGDFWARRAHGRNELIEAGQEIARRKAFYQLQVQRNEAMSAEIERLEQMLQMPAPDGFYLEPARVVQRQVNSWWHQITLRKGRDYGIPEGAAVVFEGGVVGRVVAVHAFTSDVELVSSPRFRMAATFANEERPVLYQGRAQTGFGSPTGRLVDAPQDLSASEQRPLRLVSTHLGGVFPAGLTIGTVDWLEPGGSGLFQDGDVKLDRRLLTLREATILIPREERRTPDATLEDADGRPFIR
jgi:rod shape-determining protein MreC